jgi:transcriptional regulator with XRE-family HTH domain
MNGNAESVGGLLRGWRQRRRLSQLDLACDAEISQKHLSFVESGRSAPSRDMVLRLAEQLAVPLRERNVLLVAAGFAPVYGERDLEDPGFEAARRVVELILRGHEPYPALAVDRHWALLMANRPVSHLMAGIAPKLLQAPINVLRISLHPQGLAPRIANFHEWRAHVLARLAQQAARSGDPVLTALSEELKRYPVPPGTRPARPPEPGEYAGLAVPLELITEQGVLSFLSTTTIFGTPVDVSLSELAIESFFPADRATATAMHRLFESNAFG